MKNIIVIKLLTKRCNNYVDIKSKNVRIGSLQIIIEVDLRQKISVIFRNKKHYLYYYVEI